MPACREHGVQNPFRCLIDGRKYSMQAEKEQRLPSYHPRSTSRDGEMRVEKQSVHLSTTAEDREGSSQEGREAIGNRSAERKKQRIVNSKFEIMSKRQPLKALHRKGKGQDLTWGFSCRYLITAAKKSFSLSVAVGCHKPG